MSTPNQNTPPSQEYQNLKASMDLYIRWEGMTLAERLTYILDELPPQQWAEPGYLPTLASFRDNAAEWLRITEVYKALYGSARNLERAVDQLLQDARKANKAEHIPPSKRHAVTTMSEVKAEPIAWLWWPYIAIGKLCMLDGDPGVGKSLLMTQLAASLSRGYPLPDQQGTLTLPTGGPQTTLLLSTEDGLADTLKPRLVAAEADCRKVHVLTGWLGPEDELHAFTLEHMDVLTNALRTYQPRLVVIDPIQAYLGKMDMHRANETRPLLTALARLADQHRCAVVCIRHPSKPGQGASGKAIHRGLGSVDFIAAARTGLFVEQHPVDAGKVLLCQSKSNIGVYGRTQLFSKYEGQFRWAGVTRLTAELLAGNQRGPNPLAFVEAFCWLEQRLGGGLTWSAADIETEALEAEHAKGTLRRAKATLGVISVKSRETDGGWTWRLPPLPQIDPPTITCASSISSTTSTTSTSSAPSPTGNGKSPETRSTGEDVEVTEVVEVTEDIEERGVEREKSKSGGYMCPDCQQPLEEILGSQGQSFACPTCREVFDVESTAPTA